MSPQPFQITNSADTSPFKLYCDGNAPIKEKSDWIFRDE